MKNLKKSDIVTIVILVALFMIIIVTNAGLVYKSLVSQKRKVGETQINSIKSDLDNYIANSENILLRTASGAEQILAQKNSEKELEDYIVHQKRAQKDATNGTTFNVYIAGQGWEIIPDFDMPSDYHATERNWYVGAVESDGEIYITDPYIDSMTGEMCYTLSVLLSDKNTVVAMDFTLSEIQQCVDKMGLDSGDGVAIIISNEGLIVGYNDMTYIGDDVNKVLPDYAVLYNYIKNNPGQEAFSDYVGEKSCTVFHSKTKNNWYMILTTFNGDLDSKARRQIILNIITNVLMLVVIVIFYIRNAKNRNRAEKALRSSEKFVEKITSNLKQPIADVIRMSEVNRVESSEDIRQNITEIRTAGIKMDEMMNDLSSYSSLWQDMSHKEKMKRKKEKSLSKSIKRSRNTIILILLLVVLGTSAVFVDYSKEHSDGLIRGQLTVYDGKLNEWEAEQRTILNMFTNIISARPEILDDYDYAVEWLNSIAVKYPNISVCYLANPYKEHTVIMNNGWQPDEDWKVEERDWYKKTEISPDGFSFSSPYFDEQTGNYCVTISQMVYGKNGEFLGIFGIDLYMDKLIEIFGSGYYETDYVFLVDSNGAIINHPNKEYQMAEGNTVNVADTPYGKAFKMKNRAIDHITDYNGSYSVCTHMLDESSGFSVFFVAKWWSINIWNVITVAFYIMLIVVCIIVIIVLLNRVIRSQAELNNKLSAAVDEATVAGKAKTDFLAQMSHEIRTPINAVIGMDEMILRETKDQEIREYAQNISSASNTLLNLINGILDFSKIESGKMEIISGQYETVEMVDDLVNMITGKVESKGLQFVIDIDKNIPKTLYGDDVRIKQIITNLLTNAVKYTNKGSVKMTVRAEEVSADDCTLYVEVKDTGIGIREEDKDKLFVSFQRLDERRNKNIEGTGLGMSIVAGLLSMMDSSLNVESVYGEGSTFYFRLKQKVIDGSGIGEYVRGAASPQDKKTQSGNLRLRNAAILVVDDNDMNLKVAKGLMKKLTAVPDLASSGEICIEMMNEKHYDIVLMDHMMPVMDGIETLKKLKGAGMIPKDTAVIALTANAIVGARETYIEQGFTDYLSKPIDPAQLEKILTKYLPEDKYYYEDESAPQNTAGIIVDELQETSAGQAAGDVQDSSIGQITGGKQNKLATDAGDDVRYISDRQTTGVEQDATAKEAAGEDFLEQLRNAGFNTEAAMGYAMDDEEFYKELLMTFAEDEPGKISAITDFYKARNWKDYKILVHALKSSAKAVGADELSALALEQEEASKEENEEVIDSGFENLMKTYKMVTENILKIIS
ncbi:MAG: response regulator [Eubacterium sp.]|nr:response regulator [Eubacterium sp.]